MEQLQTSVYSVRISVANIGSRRSSFIALLFRAGGPEDAPIRELVGFERTEGFFSFFIFF